MSAIHGDALGQRIEMGDYVAHITRHGSTVTIKQRQIIDADDEGIYLCGRYRRLVQPHNVVKKFEQY